MPKTVGSDFSSQYLATPAPTGDVCARSRAAASPASPRADRRPRLPTGCPLGLLRLRKVREGIRSESPVRRRSRPWWSRGSKPRPPRRPRQSDRTVAAAMARHTGKGPFQRLRGARSLRRGAPRCATIHKWQPRSDPPPGGNFLRARPRPRDEPGIGPDEELRCRPLAPGACCWKGSQSKHVAAPVQGIRSRPGSPRREASGSSDSRLARRKRSPRSSPPRRADCYSLPDRQSL